MMTIQDSEIRTIQDGLDRLRGSSAILWRYLASHSVLELRFQWPNREGNIHLSCEACDRLELPTAWDDVDLSVSASNDHSRLVLYDQKAQLRIICGAVQFDENVPRVRTSA